MMLRIYLLIAAIGLALVLKGCGAVVPATLSKLDRLSPVTADPAGFEVALDLPPGLDLRPGTEVLTLSATHDRTGDRAAGQFVLQRRDLVAGGPSAEGRLVFYRVDPSDVSRMRALQARIREMKADDADDVDGSLSVAFEGCRLDDRPLDGARGSVWLRLEEGAAFLPLIRRGRLSVLLNDQPLGPCG